MDNLPHIKQPPATEAEWFQALIDLARYLCGPDGCPWDQKQTARSFAGFLREEADELLESFENNDDHIEEELGDCLFTLLASAACAESEGRYTLEGALQKAHEKMIRRHEHVFGENKATTEEEAIRSWNQIKAEEKARKRG